ncbi:hypothetical protein ES754_04230 [Psychrobacter frigidicola]|uniref:Uncharacterized protein n=1 Tax=Psychrobacter frigidicola TaxID=45611 RepID=A0A5C7ABB7_9GAMM|nr:hypothetical protein [Psychrobacter frigidicola]TXD98153.1 hypothetical protein ES754_04230 [Psychrobacter frigidicola]
MTGYCSNSPLRCHHARSMMVLNQADNNCPHCGMSLIIANNSNDRLRLEQQLLQLSLGIMVMLLLVLVYIYYVYLV